MPSDLGDDDLQGLIEELDLAGSSDDKEPDTVKVKELPPSLVEELNTASEQLPAPVLEEPVLVKDKEPDSELLVAEDAPKQVIDIKEFVEQHSKDYDETKSNIRVDRAKADVVVGSLLRRVQDGTASSQETESLVAAVKCLVDSNGHMIRLLDSKSKLLASSKASVQTLIQQNITGGKTDEELVGMLKQEIGEDEA